MEVYEPLFKALVAAGRAVMMYDLIGRGFSHSDGELTMAAHVDQLTTLITEVVGNDRDIHLVGWSLGSVIATTCCERMGARVTKLVLIAPVGGTAASKPWTAALLKLPMGIGTAIGSLAVVPSLKKLYRSELSGMADGGALLACLCDHADRNPALPRTIMGTLRSCPELDDNTAVLARIGRADRAVLILVRRRAWRGWGRRVRSRRCILPQRARPRTGSGARKMERSAAHA